MLLADRPEAVPNSMVVRLGDKVLKRDGALIATLEQLYDDVNRWLFQ